MTDFLPLIGLLACFWLVADFARWNHFKPVRALWSRNASLAMFEYMVSKWGWSLGVLGVCFADTAGKPSAPAFRAVMCCGAFGLAAAVSVAIWAGWRHRKSPEPLRLSRGALFDGVSACPTRFRQDTNTQVSLKSSCHGNCWTL